MVFRNLLALAPFMAALTGGVMVSTPAWAQGSSGAPVGQTLPPEANSLPDDPEAPEEVVVEGLRKGPRLWLASKDGREIWLLGMTPVLPKGVMWDTSEVEKVMAESDVVMRAGANVSLSAGLGKSLGLLFKLPKLLSYTKNEDGAKLKEVLSPESWARFDRIRRATGEDEGDYEKLRPIAAIGKLTSEYYEDQNLTGVALLTSLGILEKKHKKKRVTPDVAVSLKGVKVTELAAQIDAATDRIEGACFDERLRFIETDTGKLRRRANAWAKGDVKTLRTLVIESNTQSACANPLIEAFKGNPALAKFTAAFDQSEALFYANLEKEHGPRRRILVYASIDSVLDKNKGLLAYLAGKGYAIEGP